MHKRQEIREAVKAMLLDQTLANANVYSNRVSTFWKQQLPSISVFTRDEETTPRDLANSKYVRTLNLTIEIHAEAKENLDDTLDTIADQIETLIGTDQSLGGTALGTIMTGTTVELAGEAATPVGVLTLSFQTKYIK